MIDEQSQRVDTTTHWTAESGMEATGGSPPAVSDISVDTDVLQTAIYGTTQVSDKWMVIDSADVMESGMEIAGGSPSAEVDISVGPDVLPTAVSVTTHMSEKWMVIDSPDVMESGMEMAGGSPPAEVDISVGLDVLLIVIFVMTVVSEKWMERFVMDLAVLCSDGLASGDDPAKESSDVGSDVCVVSDSMPTAVSVRTVVTEKWMDRFVMDLEEYPSVSRTSAVARTFGPAVSEEYSHVVFAGGGGRLPMHAPWLSLSQIQLEYLSCLMPVVSSRPFFGGRSPLMWSVWALARRVSEWTRRKP